MSNVQIQVCVLTYKRPAMLHATLLSLCQQQFQNHRDLSMHVLVVDNDAAASGQAAFDEIFSASSIPARYVVESAQGVARARNCALAESAAAGFDFIAFIDDDEIADPFWLDQLMDAQRKFNADVVAGPVLPVFVSAPKWVVSGGFFARKNRPSGTPLDFIASNNVLLRGEIARTRRFDLRFDSCGGEDTHFFMVLKQARARMVWANDALVSETISEQRTTAQWIMRRAHSEANRYTQACLYLAPGVRTTAIRMAKALAGLGAGFVLLPSGLAGRARAVRALQLIWRAAGTLDALRGHTHLYYPAKVKLS